MNPVIMHVNYGEIRWDCFGNNTIDDICRMAADIGFDGIEMRSAPPKEFKEMPFMEFVGQIKAAKEKYGISTLLFNIPIENIFSEDKDLRTAGVQEALEKACIVHNLFGTTLCNTETAAIRDPNAERSDIACHGSAAATREHWDLAVDAYRELAKGIEPLGMKFAFESHMNCIHDLPQACKKLVDLIDSPNIGINMDYGNTIYFSGCPSVEETIDIYGDKLFYTHLKNSIAKPGGGRTPTALSEGEINHRNYLKKLRQVGFSGPIGIEAPRPGDRYWFAQQDLGYYKAVRSSVY